VRYQEEGRDNHVDEVDRVDLGGDRCVDFKPPRAGAVSRQPSKVGRRFKMLEGVFCPAVRGVAIDGDAKGHGECRVDEEVVGGVGVPDEAGAFVLSEGDGGGVIGAVGDEACRGGGPELGNQAIIGGLATEGLFELGDEDFLPVFGVVLEVGACGGGDTRRGRGRGGRAGTVNGGGFGAFEGLVGVISGEGDVGGRRGRIDTQRVKGLTGR